MTDSPLSPDQQQRHDDAHELHALGYAEEPFRTMGGFSNFAISFSIMSILTGAVTLYEHGLVMGGPAEMAFGWPLVTFFTLAVALSIAELASSLPTSRLSGRLVIVIGPRPSDRLDERAHKRPIDGRITLHDGRAEA